MRRRAKVDLNHAEIVAALRGVGCAVESLAPLGRGVPDLLAWSPYTQRHHLIEVKSGPREPFTPAEQEWIAGWGGPVSVVRTVDEALDVVGVVVVGRTSERRE